MNSKIPNAPQKGSLGKDLIRMDTLLLPKDCPWRIEVRPSNSTDNTFEVLLVQGERILNLQDFCSGDFKGFKYGETSGYDIGEQVITFPSRLQNSKYFLPILLHEIGHSHSKQVNIMVKRVIQNINIALRILRYNQAGKFRKVFMRKPDENLIIGKTREEVYEEERFAWSYALKKMRELEMRGFYISQGCDLKATQQYMTLALLSYELHHDPLGQHSAITRRVNRKAFRTIYGNQ